LLRGRYYVFSLQENVFLNRNFGLLMGVYKYKTKNAKNIMAILAGYLNDEQMRLLTMPFVLDNSKSIRYPEGLKPEWATMSQ
jgi:hypothetical protein